MDGIIKWARISNFKKYFKKELPVGKDPVPIPIRQDVVFCGNFMWDDSIKLQTWLDCLFTSLWYLVITSHDMIRVKFKLMLLENLRLRSTEEGHLYVCEAVLSQDRRRNSLPSNVACECREGSPWPSWNKGIRRQLALSNAFFHRCRRSWSRESALHV